MKVKTRSSRSIASLIAMSALLFACGGADEALTGSTSAGTTGASTEQIAARKWVDVLPNGKTWQQTTTSSTLSTASTGTTATASQDTATTTASLDGTTTATSSEPANTTTIESTSATTVVDPALTTATAATTTSTAGADSASNVLDVATDPRTVVAINADTASSQHPNYAIAITHGPDSTAVAPNVGVRPWYFSDIGANGYLHSDGAAWIKREQRPDGKLAFTLRLKKGQAEYAVGGGTGSSAPTLRAEISTMEGLGWEAHMIDEDGGDYWIGWDHWFDQDLLANTGGMSISEAHNVTWRTGKYYSEGHPVGMVIGGQTVYFRLHGPGCGGSFTYDVRTTPLSTTPISTSGPTCGTHGTNHWWKIANVGDVVGKSFKLIARVRYANSTDKNPRTEVWRKIGSGPLVKIIDVNYPNTHTTGYKYPKTGLYTWEDASSDSWWSSVDTRTMRMRSILWIRNEPSAGRANLDQNVMLGWLER